MYKIAEEFIPRWKLTDEQKLPATVDTICPYCGFPMVFTLEDWTYVEATETWATKSICANCADIPRFFWLSEPSKADEGDSPHALYMHPEPRLMRRPLEGISRIPEFDESLQRAYAASINVYNAREWTGTAVVSRRTVEDIIKALVPQDRSQVSLAIQIEALPRKRDLARPVMMLADALKRNSPLAPYFDLEKTPDQQAATLIVELLNCLVEYLFVLPGRIQTLQEQIRDLPE